MRLHSILKPVGLIASLFALSVSTACSSHLGMPGQPAASSTMPTAGTLVVSLEVGRRIQATTAEVERIVVRVQSLGFDEEQIATIEKAAWSTGQASLTFASVPESSVLIELTAWDAGGRRLGAVTRGHYVQSGQVNQVNIPFQLDPTYTASSPSPTGGLTTAFSFLPSMTTAGTITRYPVGTQTSVAMLLGIDAQGMLYISTPNGYDKVSPQGVKVASVVLPSSVPAYWGKVDSAGHLWVRGTDSKVRKFGPNGTELAQYSLPLMSGWNSSYTDINFHPGGDLWFIRPGTGIARLSSSGTPLGDISLPQVSSLAFGALGEAWISAGTKLVKTSPIGDILKEAVLPSPPRSQEYGAPALSLGRPLVDSTGDVWVTMPGYGLLFKLSSDGQLQGQYTVPLDAYSMFEDKTGHLWAVCRNDSDVNLTQLNKSGAMIGRNRIGATPSNPYMDAQGNLWWLHADKGTVLGRLTP